MRTCECFDCEVIIPADADRRKRFCTKYCKNRQFRANNADSVKARRTEWKFKQYGITLADYDKMVAYQGDRCGICKTAEKPNNNYGPTSWNVDHDHKTGEVRGLLCSDCNTALGLLRDDIDLMTSAMAYLLQSTNVLKPVDSPGTENTDNLVKDDEVNDGN